MPATPKTLRIASSKGDSFPLASIPETPSVQGGSKWILYGTTILLSGFLLFQIELIMAKFLLPRFGGGPSVWSTSMLVFQVLLLTGYGYASFSSTKLSTRRQGVAHIALLAVSGLAMAVLSFWTHSPLLPSKLPLAATVKYPVWGITALLLTSVGIQCVLLSATSPLLQHWIGRAHAVSPYRLYALSNLGSMLGLLAYPLLVERVLTLPAQGWCWTAGYALFCLSAVACALFLTQVRGLPSESEQSKRRIRRQKKTSGRHPRVLWLALAACSSVMLLATTNLICQQIAAIPLLWVIPLILYLVSFIICFDHARWYNRGVFYPIYLFFTLLALQVLPSYAELPVIRLILIYSSALMAVCMVCHGELVRLKPETQGLSSFYLYVSAGGALGSSVVVLLAPQIFDRFWEFQIAIVGCGLLAAWTTLRDRTSWFYGLRYGRALFGVALFALIAGTGYFTYRLLRGDGSNSEVLLTRNFFGIKAIFRDPDELQLLHGDIQHGIQWLHPEARRTPTLYYARDSGIGLFLDHYERPPGRSLRVGVIGMGVGTLAAYGKAGDYFRFYEIDPAVPQFSLGAHPLFTFIEDSPAHTDVVLGDARIKMKEEVSNGELQDFDVLVVDAFSGDSIPIHLLTREAMEVYLRELHGPQSVIAFHISSNALQLSSVIAALANYYHLGNIEVDTTSSWWVLLSQDQNVLRQSDLAEAGHPIEVEHRLRLWTDEYSSVFDALSW